MTKEQAIDHLKADIKYWQNTSVSTEHLEMAIKALEQQPSDDCVSRQKVKEGMRKYGFHSSDMTITEFTEDELPSVTPKVPTSGDCVSRKDLLAQINESWETIETKLDFVNIVKTLPSVKPKVSTFDDCVSRAEVIRLAEQGQIQGFVWQIQKLITMSPVTPKVPSDDCVSRQAVLKLLESYVDEESLNDGLNNICYEFVSEKIKKLPPVIPTHKVCKWIGVKHPICPKCNCNIIEEYISYTDYARMYKPMKFCPNCGADMRGAENE